MRSRLWCRRFGLGVYRTISGSARSEAYDEMTGKFRASMDMRPAAIWAMEMTALGGGTH
jgi:hypothetical protein